MLTNAPVHATLIVENIERAKKFYVEKLGLKITRTDPSPGAVLQAGESTTLYIYEGPATKATNTVASFTVKDVIATVKELKANGVAFEDYDTPDLKTVDGIAEMGGMKGAWFKDTEGNILAVTDM